MKRTIQWIAAILAWIMLVSLEVTVLGAETGEIYFYENFDACATNGVADGISVMNVTERVVVDGEKNKALQIGQSEQEVIVKKTFETKDQMFMTNVDLKYSGDPLCLKIGLSAGTSKLIALTVEDGIIKSHDGKKIGGLKQNVYTRVAIAYNFRNGIYSVFIDNKRVLKDWTLPGSIAPTEFYLARQSGGALYLDNMAAYEGATLRSNFVGAGYSEEATDYLPIDDDVGDYTYFHSDYIINTSGYYPNFTAYPKTNRIECERYDYQNKDKGDCIILEKTGSDDVYIDITTEKYVNYSSTKTYQYFMIAGEFWYSNKNMDIQMFLLKDTVSANSQIQTVTGRILGDNSIKPVTGSNIQGAVRPGEWFSYKVYINLAEHHIDTYINDKKVMSEIPFNENFNVLNLVRLSVTTSSGNGTLKARKLEVTGMVKDYNEGEVWTDVFADDDAVENYLENKTAFHHYAQNYYQNGVKTLLTTPSQYVDGELYIDAEDFNAAFGTSLYLENDVLSDGTTKYEYSLLDGLVPVKTFCSEVLGKQVLDDGYGMVLISDEKMYFDPEQETPYYMEEYVVGQTTKLSSLQHLNDYLFFERPSAQTLRETFQENTQDGAMHPRIMASREDFERIVEQSKSDDYLDSLLENLLLQADKILNEAPVEYQFMDSMRLWRVAYNFTSRMERLGFAWQVTGDRKYVDRAWEEMQSVCSFPDFNVNHVIDAGLFCTGMGIGYDWMYDGFTEEQRELISSTAIKLGLSVLDKAFYGRLPSAGSGGKSGGTVNCTGIFPKWKSNYNTYVNGGLIVCALAMAETDPDLCFDVLEKSIRSLEYTMKNLVPEGAWIESSDYWLAAMRFLANSISSLEVSLGDSYNFGKYPGFENTGYFMYSMNSVLGENAYHDVNENADFAEYPFSFLGKYFGQKAMSAARKLTLSKTIPTITNVEVHPMDLIFYDPEAEISDLDTIPRLQVTRGMESFGFHEAAYDPEAMYVSAHGGPTSYYHGHNDGGSFVLDLGGVRWAIDLGKEDYNLTGNADARYRQRAEGHNTLVINPSAEHAQKAQTFAPIIATAETERGAYVVYDMSDLYEDAASLQRGFYIGDDFTSLTIRDEMELTTESTVYWFMHTRADIDISDDGSVLLSLDGKSISLQFKTDADSAEVEAMAAEALPSTPKLDGQKANTGVNKVAIKLTGSGKVNLTVRIGLQSDSVDDTPIAAWTLPEGERQTEREDFGYQLYLDGVLAEDASVVPLIDEKQIPEITFVPNDPTKIVEAELTEDITQKITVRVYDSTKQKVQTYKVRYITNGPHLLSLYDSLPIAGVVANSEPEPENKAVNMIDGDSSTRWTGLAKEDYAVIDLGERREFDAIAVSFWKGSERQYSYEIWVSDDGETYQKLKQNTSSGDTEEVEILKLGASAGRYVKIVGKGNTANNVINVTEFMVLRSK